MIASITPHVSVCRSVVHYNSSEPRSTYGSLLYGVVGHRNVQRECQHVPLALPPPISAKKTMRISNPTGVNRLLYLHRPSARWRKIIILQNMCNEQKVSCTGVVRRHVPHRTVSLSLHSHHDPKANCHHVALLCPTKQTHGIYMCVSQHSRIVLFIRGKGNFYWHVNCYNHLRKWRLRGHSQDERRTRCAWQVSHHLRSLFCHHMSLVSGSPQACGCGQAKRVPPKAAAKKAVTKRAAVGEAAAKKANDRKIQWSVHRHSQLQLPCWLSVGDSSRLTTNTSQAQRETVGSSTTPARQRADTDFRRYLWRGTMHQDLERVAKWHLMELAGGTVNTT